jgi:hypothetical protein
MEVSENSIPKIFVAILALPCPPMVCHIYLNTKLIKSILNDYYVYHNMPDSYRYSNEGKGL